MALKRKPQTELAIESSVHIGDFGSEDYLALCRREKIGEIRIYWVAVSSERLWRVQWEIIRTPEVLAATTLTPKSEQYIEMDLLTVETKHRMPF